MAEIQVSIKGLETIQRNLANLTPEMKLRIGQALSATALNCQTDARKLCPVGTPESTHRKGYIGGRLRASIRIRQVAELAWEVFTDVTYSWFVELGTRKMKAKPYLHPAWQMNQEKLMKRLITILKTNFTAGGGV